MQLVQSLFTIVIPSFFQTVPMNMIGSALLSIIILCCGQVLAQQGVVGGLANQNLVIVAEEWSPYWTISTTPDGREEYGGVLYDLLLFMQQARDFNFTMVRSPDGSWGDGGCSSAADSVGMMGMAARKEVDLAIGKRGKISSFHRFF